MRVPMLVRVARRAFKVALQLSPSFLVFPGGDMLTLLLFKQRIYTEHNDGLVLAFI